jgi:hypothetical protein
MKRVVRIIIFFILPAVIVLLAAAMIALPYVAKDYINKHGKEYTGRQLSVDQIKINYLTTTFNVLGFKMFEANDRETFLSFDTLTVDVNPIRLFSSELEIGKLRLVRPEVVITRKDSVFNFDDIIAFLNSKNKADTVKASEPFKYVLKNISMEKGKLTFNDLGVNYTNVLTNLGFTLPYISYNQADISEAGLKFFFENGGFFQAKAGYNQKIGTYNADVTVDKLDISPLLPYLKDYYRFKSITGFAEGKFHLDGNLSHPDSIKISGDGKVNGFQANDLSGRKVLGARSAEVTLNDSYPMKYIFRMDKVTLTEPYVYFEMKDSTNNFLGLMVETPDSGEPFNYYYQINHFVIDGGLVDFRDNSYGDPFDYHFDNISLSVDSVSSTAKWLNAYSTMRLNKRGTLKAELGINPSDPYELKIDYVITNFQLSDLSVISRYYVGFPFVLGNMYYKGKTVITARQLTSENKLIIRNAKLGKKRGGLMNIPLKIALYVLKDVHGDITLDLPVSGDLNDPKTKVGKLVWQVLKNFIVKIASSPFRALSGLVGVDPDEIKGIEFNYADTTLTNRDLKRIKLYTELEKKKPDMKVELAYYNDPALEKQEIAVEEAGKLFNAATGADFKKDKAKFTSFLAEKLQSDTVSTVSGSMKLIGNAKVDSIQNSIVKKRIRRIEDALRAADDSTRIKVLIPDKQAPENVGSRPVFELKYSMEE